jgi:hypothetical protein
VTGFRRTRLITTARRALAEAGGNALSFSPKVVMSRIQEVAVGTGHYRVDDHMGSGRAGVTVPLLHDVRTCSLLSALVFTLYSLPVPAQTNSSGANTGSQEAAKDRDGRHDFDWDIGTWKTHQRRLLHPLTGSSTWVEYHGTDVVRKIWDGANLGEIRADGPAGHLELFTVRLYSPASHEWSIYFTNSTSGALSPPAVGRFKDGRGEFYDQETYNGRTILLRFSVSDISADSCHFEQAFSADGGKTWEVNFIVTETLVKGEPDKVR